MMATSGAVGGYVLPADWLRGCAPFSDYLGPGLILLVVIGLGGVLTAMLNVLDARLGSAATLAYGAILVGWILGELVFMTQTMILTRVILATGLVLVALAGPDAAAVLAPRLRHPTGERSARDPSGARADRPGPGLNVPIRQGRSTAAPDPLPA